MRFRVNGRDVDTDTTPTLAAVIAAAGILDVRGIAVAVDGEVVRRDEWQTRTVKQGARIDVVRAVQGG